MSFAPHATMKLPSDAAATAGLAHGLEPVSTRNSLPSATPLLVVKPRVNVHAGQTDLIGGCPYGVVKTTMIYEAARSCSETHATTNPPFFNAATAGVRWL